MSRDTTIQKIISDKAKYQSGVFGEGECGGGYSPVTFRGNEKNLIPFTPNPQPTLSFDPPLEII